MPRTDYDIIIAGAGPAGTTCALALRNSGLRVALIDKASFPRDKVCGDAIPGRAVRTLYKLGPEFESSFKALPLKLVTKNTSLYYNGRNLSFTWVGEAYTCTRLTFDDFLFSEAANKSNAEILTGAEIRNVRRENDITIATMRDGRTLSCRLFVGADGANSVTARQLTGREIDRNNHVGSVRAYYTNVSTVNPHTTEVYFLKEFLPSYLWIFPLPGNRANVGFGMLSSEIARRNLDLKKLFHEFIARSPEVAAKLQGAIMDGPLAGFGLPLGGKSLPISGEGYLLAGDAASVIDPMSGDGIGNAMLSGRLAAEQAMQCFREENFSAAFMRTYDRHVRVSIGKELKTHYKARRLLAAAPFLLDIIFAAGGNVWVKKMLQKSL